GEADGVRKGIELIREKKPEVVFLDIQMPDGSGFRLLEEVREEVFEVIFTTAFDQFAIKAIKYSALDYLLKPINPSELVAAVNKLKRQEFRLRAGQHIEALLENLRNPEQPRKIVLNTAERIHVVEVDHIIRCESDNYYTRFFFTDGKTLLISKTLKENEELLREHHFIRPHKSHLVNLKFVKHYSRHDGGLLILEDGTRVPVSRRKRELVVETISHIGTGSWP
ncbi:MAG TPA: LytTR family DNA-binding domain-containing protein, partial [Bacteroidales bacterium]|nr:LytTR family DNA-binding domain-containing protein [Bacteroidales bacterium]